MLSMPGYTRIREIHRGKKRAVYRAVRELDDCPVIIKILRKKNPGSHEVGRLKREYEITRGLSSAEVVRAYALEKYDGVGPALILEDFGGESLRKLLRKRAVPPLPFLRIAIRLTDALGVVHKNNIIHKDIKPDNIIINRDSGVVKITDFGISSIFTLESPEAREPEALEGTLAYVSPEQTGRMNRALDYRTDYYSLGVLFYEMVTGRLPFTAKDPMELISHHVARMPESPHQINPDVPEAISRIVMKLLAKSPDERYRSYLGLKNDLLRIFRVLKEKGDSAPFTPGSDDVSEKFQIHTRLYGRETELERARAALAATQDNPLRMITLTGPSGMGKTALLDEVGAQVLAGRAYFARGGFQDEGEHEYQAIVQTFRELTRHILTREQDEIDQWNRALLEALGADAGVLTEVVEGLKLILGRQAPVPELPLDRTRERFHRACAAFLGTFASREHTLVLGLENLHWADTASLELIRDLIRRGDLRGITIIGTYRRPDEEHPLRWMLRELETGGHEVEEIALSPLRGRDAIRLLQDSFHCEGERAEELADLLVVKTGGSPYFLIEFLRDIHGRKLLFFERGRGRWEWDIRGIRQLETTDNVVDLAAEKVRGLPESPRHILWTAACIGRSCNTAVLSALTDIPLEQLGNELAGAFELNLIESGDEGQKPSADGLAGGDTVLRFPHGRLHEAVLQLIPDNTRKDLHLRIGKYYRALLDESPEERLRLDCVRHLDFARDLLETREERSALAELNLMAGRTQRASSDYIAALKYLRIGIELMPEDAWEADYRRMYELHRERLECEYLAGNFEQAESLFVIMLTLTNDDLDLADIYVLQITQLTHQGRYTEAILAGQIALTLMGVIFPDEDADLKALTRAEIEEVRATLKGRSIKSISDLPAMTSPEQIAIMKLLMTLAAPAYLSDARELTFLIAAKMVHLSLEHGNTAASAFGYCWYGRLLAGEFHEYREAYEYGSLALAVNVGHNDFSLKCRLFYGFTCWISSWRKPLNTGFLYFREAHQAGLESGDIIFAALALSHEVMYRLIAGGNLRDISREFAEYPDMHRRTRHDVSRDIHRLCLRWALAMRGKTESPTSLDGDGFLESELLREYARMPLMLGYHGIIKLHVLFLAEDYGAALEEAKRTREHISAVSGVLLRGEVPVLESLACAALFAMFDEDEQKEALALIEENRVLLRNWWKHCPENFEHKFLLVEAEFARIKGKQIEAMEYYDKAVDSAREHGFTGYEALANELAAKFYIAIGKQRFASLYMREACELYSNWGAKPKFESLKERYPDLVAVREEAAATHVESDTVDTETSSSGNRKTGSIMELSAFMKASQALSGEIRLSNLLKEMMKVLMEYTGAQHGYLILDKEGRLFVEADGAASRDETVILNSVPADAVENLPRVIINYVARTKESIVLADAGQEPLFANDESIGAQQLKSVLCIPVMGQAKLMGLIYLENNLGTGVFTRDRLEVVNLLAAQLAISIRNANLYTTVEEMAQSFARFVPSQFLEMLEKESINKVGLGDAVEKELTVLFSDIRRFTHLSELMSVKDNFQFLNSYLKRMGPVINRNMGFVDKFIGDAIMALFAYWPGNALRAAIEMREALKVFNQHRMEWGLDPIETGIGLHIGKVMLGTLGTHGRLETTVIGDAVNLAARLESITKAYKTPIILSSALFAKLDDTSEFHLREIDSVRVRGKSKVVVLYECFDADPPETIERKVKTLDRFTAGLVLYKGGNFREALRLFSECADTVPEDPIPRMYEKRCVDLLSEPPGEDWQGIVDL